MASKYQLIKYDKQNRLLLGPESSQLVCHECSLNFDTFEDLQSHHNQTHPDPGRYLVRYDNRNDCPLCQEALSPNETLKTHLKRKHFNKKLKKIEELELVFQLHSSLRIVSVGGENLANGENQDVVSDSENNEVENSVPEIGDNCEEEKDEVNELENQLKFDAKANITKPSNCISTNQASTSKANISIENNQAIQLDQISSNQQHSQVKSKNLSAVSSNPPEKVSHLCPFCENSFSSLVSLKEHIIEDHPRDILNAKNEMNSGSNEASCKTTSSSAMSHVLNNNRDSELITVNNVASDIEIEMNECGNETRNNTNQEARLENEDIQEISRCKKAKQIKTKVKITRSTVRKSLPRCKNAICSHCNNCFTGFRGLKIHISLKHPEKSNGKYKCCYCQNKYSNKSHLNQHIRKCHPGKPLSQELNKEEWAKFNCSQCNNYFTGPIGLNIHISHKHPENINSEYYCFYCPKKFTSRTSLKSHINKCHPGKPYAQKLFKQNLAIFKCSHCSDYFTHLRGLNKHISRIHPEKFYSKYICGYCQNKFSRQSNLARHIKKCHPGKPLKHKQIKYK